MLVCRFRQYPKFDIASSDNMQIDGKKVASNHIDKNNTSITSQSTVSYHNAVLSNHTGAVELLATLVNTKLLL